MPPRAPGRRLLLVFVVALALCSLPFILRPDLDLGIAWWITDGGRFLPATGLVWLVYVGLRPLIYGVALVIAVLTVFSALRGRPVLGLDRRAGAFLLLSLALGPGLAVDVGLKDHWDRARPRDLVEYGGTASYTGPFVLSDQCRENCSFVSGHAAQAFWFIAFAFLARPPWRRILAALAIGGGLLVGLMRMAQGAHFLSDVIFAGFVVIAIVWAVHALLYAGSAGDG